MESKSLAAKENVSSEQSECLLNNNGDGRRNSWCSNLHDIGVIGLIDSEDVSSDPPSQVSQSPLRSPLRPVEVSRCRSPNTAFIQDFKRVKRYSDGSIKLSKNNFDKLSDEIIVDIFSLVPKHVLATLSLVCKRFRRLCLDESLWTRYDLSFKTLPPYTLGYVLSRGVKALRLNSSAVTTPVFDPAQPFKDLHSFRVEYLDLSAVHILIQDLEQVLTLCRNLKKLSLEACEVSDMVCHNIACNTKLDTLDMAMCSNLNSTGLLEIVKNCKRLENVNISWCNLTPEALCGFCREVSHHLISVNLAGALRSLSNDDVDQLLSRCPDLTELDISDCTKVTGAVIESLVNKSENIQKLAISRCYKISASNVLLLKGKASLCMLNMFGNSQGSMFMSDVMTYLKNALPGVAINTEMMSPIARPTVGIRRTSIWEIRCRD